jgi:hypothetical protein
MVVLNDFLTNFLINTDFTSTLNRDFIYTFLNIYESTFLKESSDIVVTLVNQVAPHNRVIYYLADPNRTEICEFTNWNEKACVLRSEDIHWISEKFNYNVALDSDSDSDSDSNYDLLTQFFLHSEKERARVSDLRIANLNDNMLREAAMNTELLYIQELELMVDYGIEDIIYPESDSDLET